MRTRGSPLVLAALVVGAVAWAGCGPTCGDGVVEGDERCEEDGTERCATTCGTTGVRRCGAGTCQWEACEAPEEQCNGADDDCDGTLDEGFACSPGAREACETECGTEGSRVCGAGCGWEACEPPAERCGNGIDDDCDGTTDAMAMRPPVVLLTDLAHSPFAVAADADGFTLVRVAVGDAGRVLVLHTFDHEGTPREVGRELISLPGEPHALSLATNGRGGALVTWAARRTFYLLTLQDGVVVQAAQEFAVDRVGSMGAHAVAWLGDEYLLAYSDVPGAWKTIRVQPVPTSGRPRPSFALTDPVGEFQQAIDLDVHAPSRTGAVVWHRDRHRNGEHDIALARIGDHGRTGPVLWLTESDENLAERVRNTYPAVVSAGPHQGVVWSRGEYERGRIVFARVSDGVVGPTRPVARSRGDATRPKIVWTGTEYGVAWNDASRDQGTIRFVRLAPDGARIGPPIDVATGASTRGPHLVFSGGAYLVVHASADGRVLLSRGACE